MAGVNGARRVKIELARSPSHHPTCTKGDLSSGALICLQRRADRQLGSALSVAFGGRVASAMPKLPCRARLRDRGSGGQSHRQFPKALPCAGGILNPSERYYVLITLNCHCGNVSISFESLPASLRDCDCPMCNRLGALWADFTLDEVRVQTTSAPTVTYRWGDKDYEMHHCPSCGCTTHYASVAGSATREFGVNMRLLDRAQLKQLPIAPRCSAV